MSILSTYVRMVHKNKSDAARLIFYSFFVKVIIHSFSRRRRRSIDFRLKIIDNGILLGKLCL